MIALPLKHAGIMPNYECTAACRHCLYACSPSFSGGYMAEDVMDSTFKHLQTGGCRSVHIGGGEPFIDFEGLLTLISKANKYRIAVDYIETNASWAADEATIVAHISQLEELGVDTFCISLDPFHAEYVPYGNPLRLAEVCKKQGFGYFLWQERFLGMLKNVNPNTHHTREALENAIGKDYIFDTAKSYGIGYGGRAIAIEQEYMDKKPVETLLNTKACRGLASTGHFHVDMYGRFIPPGCTGLVLPLAEVVQGIPQGKYPVYEALFTGGVGALYALATAHGFTPEAGGYTSSCALCFFMRQFLASTGAFQELFQEHYVESLKYY